MKTIYDCSSRTRLKILKRLKLHCFECDWHKAHTDIHHIVPISKGGTNDHSNLTSLCPSCHRLAHLGLIDKFYSIEEKIGDTWKDYFNPQNKWSANSELAKKASIEGNKKSIVIRQNKAKIKYKKLIEQIKESNIDFQKFGWVERVATQFNIRHQHVSRIIKKYDPVFYETCYQRGR